MPRNNKYSVVSFLLLFVALTGKSQNSAVWTDVFTGQTSKGLALNLREHSLVIWGNSTDTICQQAAVGLIKVDTNGVFIVDTVYELNYCYDENPVRFTDYQGGKGYYLISDNDMSTPQDSCYIYYIDSTLTMQWSRYAGQSIRSEIFAYKNENYYSSDNLSQVKQTLRFDRQGNLDTTNAVTYPYFTQAPKWVMCENGLVVEVGNKASTDTAFMGQVYDTLGNYFTQFAFDANSTQQEAPWFVGISHNQIFHVCSASSNNMTYPAASGVSGITNWVDTLYHRMHGFDGACIDSINEVGFVLCDALPDDRIIFSYDLYTGVLLDSIRIDSVDAIFSGIKSGPSGGVYIVYNKRYLNKIFVEQYDQGLNLIWSGYAEHPTCNAACNVMDFIIDTIGNVYTLSNCGACVGEAILVSKFGASLVDVPDVIEQHSTVKLSPDPASEFVRIELSGEIGKNELEVHDLSGRLVKTQSYEGGECVLDVSQYAPGLYFIVIITKSGEQFNSKFIKVNQ